jgi:glycosyltransferase involved in cell wall biosynthesis
VAPAVTVAIPVLDAGLLWHEVLAGVAAQRVDRDVELLVCDSGSRDGSAEVAVRAGARLLRIRRGTFSHGGTRNLLVREGRGAHVAFLTQDATPADEHWLQRLLDGFALGPRVGLVSGSYVPRHDAPLHVRRELVEFFAELGGKRVYERADRSVAASTFHSDANGALAKAAWKQVPFRPMGYAEDQALARDMLAAGFAHAYVPDAAVIHSHAYRPLEQLRRHFTEFRALREVYGHVADAHPYRLAGHVRREVRHDRAYGRAQGLHGAALDSVTWRSLVYHGGRALAAAAGSRA